MLSFKGTHHECSLIRHHNEQPREDLCLCKQKCHTVATKINNKKEKYKYRKKMGHRRDMSSFLKKWVFNSCLIIGSVQSALSWEPLLGIPESQLGGETARPIRELSAW